MIIKDGEVKKQELEKIKTGGVFRYQGEYYMKINNHLSNVVNLETGDSYKFDDDTMVDSVEAELGINN